MKMVLCRYFTDVDRSSCRITHTVYVAETSLLRLDENIIPIFH